MNKAVQRLENEKVTNQWPETEAEGAGFMASLNVTDRLLEEPFDGK